MLLDFRGQSAGALDGSLAAATRRALGGTPPVILTGQYRRYRLSPYQEPCVRVATHTARVFQTLEPAVVIAQGVTSTVR